MKRAQNSVNPSSAAPSGTTPRVARIGTLPVDSLTMTETVQRLEKLINEPGVSQHVSVNAAKVVAAENDEELRRIISGCDVISGDGMSVVWASRLLGQPLPERVTGIDVMFELFQLGEEREWGVFLLGGNPKVITTTVERVRTRYPHLRISGSRNGYWKPEEEPSVVEEVRASGADVLLVAIPTPAKERFVGRNRRQLGVNLVVGVGGSFDIIAGRTRRAPLWMQKAGLEWLYRFVQEPKRMWKRYLVGNVKFILLVGRQWLRRR